LFLEFLLKKALDFVSFALKENFRTGDSSIIYSSCQYIIAPLVLEGLLVGY